MHADYQTFPHPETDSAQRELNPRFRHGKTVGFRYIMGACLNAELSKIKEHWEGIEPSLPHYECGVLPLDHQCLFQWDRRGSNPHQTG
jgi:hypothetical protein